MYAVLILVIHACSFVIAEPNLIIIQKMEDLEIAAPSLLQVQKGSNLSLICKIEDTNKHEQLNGQVQWSRKRRKARFSDIDDMLLMENNIPDPVLNFSNVTMEDQGLYFCKSFKNKLIKVINIVVKIGLPRLRKYKKSYLIDSYDRRKKLYNKGVPRVRRDVYYVTRKEKSTTPFPGYWDSKNDDSDKFRIWYEDEQKWKTWDNKYLNSDANDDKDDKKNEHHIKSNFFNTGFFYVMAGGLAFFFIVCVIKRCCDESDESPTSTYNPTQTNLPLYHDRSEWNSRHNRPAVDSNLCSHLACIHNRSLHPFANCLLNRNGVVVQRDDGNLLPLSRLDLPPSYEDSTANSLASSTHSLYNSNDEISNRILVPENDNPTLPPTYEEALTNEYDEDHSSSRVNLGNNVEMRCDADVAGESGGDSGGCGGDSGGGCDSGGGGGDDS